MESTIGKTPGESDLANVINLMYCSFTSIVTMLYVKSFISLGGNPSHLTLRSSTIGFGDFAPKTVAGKILVLPVSSRDTLQVAA